MNPPQRPQHPPPPSTLAAPQALPSSRRHIAPRARALTALALGFALVLAGTAARAELPPIDAVDVGAGCFDDTMCGCGCACVGGACRCTGAIPPSCASDTDCGPACLHLACVANRCVPAAPALDGGREDVVDDTRVPVSEGGADGRTLDGDLLSPDVTTRDVAPGEPVDEMCSPWPTCMYGADDLPLYNEAGPDGPDVVLADDAAPPRFDAGASTDVPRGSEPSDPPRSGCACSLQHSERAPNRGRTAGILALGVALALGRRRRTPR